MRRFLALLTVGQGRPGLGGERKQEITCGVLLITAAQMARQMSWEAWMEREMARERVF